MTWGKRLTPSGRIVLSALAGALVAAVLVTLIGGRPVAVRSAAATKAATATAASASGTAAASRTHSVTFIGDSWTFGEGATALRGYAVLTAEQLGWQYQTLGVGGSGYTLGLSTFDQRVDHAVATDPDVIVVEGSLNERTTAAATLAAAADATLAHLRADADPKTRILVLGATYSPGTPNATIDSINAVIHQAADRSGLEFVDPAAENWIDASDASLWHDPDHPNDVGHQVVADRLKPVLRAMVSG